MPPSLASFRRKAGNLADRLPGSSLNLSESRLWNSQNAITKQRGRALSPGQRGQLRSVHPRSRTSHAIDFRKHTCARVGVGAPHALPVLPGAPGLAGLVRCPLPHLSTPFPGKLPGARGWGCVHGHCQAGGAWHPPLNPGATASRSGLRRHVALFRLESAGHLFQLSFLKKSEMFPLSDRAAQESLPRPRARCACAPSSAAATGHGRPWSPGSYVTV